MAEPLELRLESTTYLLQGSLAWRPFASVHGQRLEVLALEGNRWKLYVVDARGQSLGAPAPVIADEVTAFARCGSHRLVVGAVEGRPRLWNLDDAGAVLRARDAPIRMRPICVDDAPFGVDVGFRDPTVVSVFDLAGDQPRGHLQITLEGRTHEHAAAVFGSELVLVRAGTAARPVEVWFIPAHGGPPRHTSIPGTECAIAPGVALVEDRLAVLWAPQGATQMVMPRWIRANGELDGPPIELQYARDICATFAVWAPQAALAVGYTTKAMGDVDYDAESPTVGRHAYHYDTWVAICDTASGRVGRFIRVSGSERECHWVDGRLLALSGEECNLKVSVLVLVTEERRKGGLTPKGWRPCSGG